MTIPISIKNTVINDHEAAKLAATQHQLMDLAQNFDALHRSYENLTALVGNNSSLAVSEAPPLIANDGVNEDLLAEIKLLTQEVLEWRNFKQSRTYRLSQYYSRLYDKPVIGGSLRFMRKIVALLKNHR